MTGKNANEKYVTNNALLESCQYYKTTLTEV